MSAERRDAYVERKRAAEMHRRARRWTRRHNTRVVHQPADRAYRLHVAPARVGVSSHLPDRQGKTAHEHPHRGIVRGWTSRSKERFRRAIAAIHWPTATYALLTLTYPGAFPRDPELWRQQRKAWAQAWRRRWPLFAVHVLEFQARGAPHFHIAAVLPEGVDIDELRLWSAVTWHRIVTGCSGDHDQGVGLGADCDPWHFEQALAEESVKIATDAKGVIRYLTSELGKESQKSLPDWLDADPSSPEEPRGAGRWWGLWGFRLEEALVALRDRREFLAMRRALRGHGLRYAARRRAEIAAFRASRLARGRPWSPRPRAPDAPPPGAWLRPPDGMGMTVRDPWLRGDLLARTMLGALDALRGRARGSFAALELACPQPVLF